MNPNLQSQLRLSQASPYDYQPLLQQHITPMSYHYSQQQNKPQQMGNIQPFQVYG
jgi:hypothetical protein